MTEEPATSQQRHDPELEALPEPRRPWRRATLLTLAVTLVSSVALCVALLNDAQFALVGGQPTELDSLEHFQPADRYANTWVRGAGALDAHASGYRRPLDPDRFRIAPVAGNQKVWVELREPAGSRHEHFVPPSSFVGRLVPLSDPGLRHGGLAGALEQSGQPAPGPDAWLLIDGETPSGARWVFGVIALLLAFGAFSAWGMYTLLSPAGLKRAG